MTRARETGALLLVATGLLGLLFVVALASLAPSSAQAGDICVGHPSDASVVCVRKNDTIVDVCDRDPDGHRAYARVITQTSSPNFLSPYYDGNDSKPGCANIPFPSKVLSVAVCVQSEGCSAFKQTAPPAAPTVPPPAPPPSAPGGDPVVYAAGDISCDRAKREEAMRAKALRCQSMATYGKIRELESQRGNPGLPTAVLALGDIQYERGSLSDFNTFYARDWGPLKPVTFPAVGNHEYRTEGALGYWQYFDPTMTSRFGARGKGWYAFNVGAWRIYAINSNCRKLGGDRTRPSCARGSEQYNWLRQDMLANPRTCSLMFMHHPYWDSSKDNFNTSALRPLIEEFWGQGGDVVLAGHAHDYERFGRSNPAQQLVFSNTRRFRLFIVGTGGKDLRGLGSKEPNSRLRDNTDLGVLQLRLGSADYGWRFASAVNTKGGVLDDRGTEPCNPPVR